ncbi:hypothetical protein QUA70_12845 [Microcoleus sp. LAD1_D5]
MKNQQSQKPAPTQPQIGIYICEIRSHPKVNLGDRLGGGGFI